VNHQTVSTSNDCDQSIGAVIAVFMLLAFVVKVVLHSAATMDTHNSKHYTNSGEKEALAFSSPD
jgi:hypothetical protein